MVTQTELINYYSSIDKALRSSHEEKRHIIKALRSDVEDYLTEFPEASLENLMSRFGTPDSIANEHMRDMPIDEISKRISSAKANKKTVLIVLVVIAAITFIYLLSRILIALDFSTQYYDEEIISASRYFIERRNLL